MVTDAERRRAWLALNVHLQALFNERRWLQPEDWTIHVGLSGYFREPTVPAEFRDTARARRLGITSRYFLGRVGKPCRASRSNGWVSVSLPPDLVDEPLEYTVAFLLKPRADLVWDDAAELSACGFPNTDVADQLSTRTRQQVYGGALRDIRLPPSDAAVRSLHGDATFAAAAAEKATYAGEDWLYYPKWLEEKPSEPRDRVFGFDRLSDDYLRLNFLPIELQKHFVYVVLRIPSERVSVLARLYRDEGRPDMPLFHEVLNVQGLTEYGDHFALATELLRRRAAGSRKPPAEAWFLYALQGTDQAPPCFAGPVEDGPGIALQLLEQVVDPQHMVQSVRGRAWNDVEDDKRKWSSRDWLKELIRLRFSEPWVWFKRDPQVEMFYDIDRESLFLRELRAEVEASTGGLKAQLRKFLDEVTRDPGLHLVRRGSTFGSKRVVGSDDSYVYLYDNARHLLTRLPMYAFWRDVNVSRISTVIYENTRGMIPIAKVIVWGGTLVAGAAVVGTQTLVALGRQYVGEKLRGVVVNEAVERAVNTVRERLLLSLLGPIMALVPAEYTKEGSAKNHLFRFFKGFIQGYTHDAMAAMFGRWESLARLEPAAYRTLKLMMKLEAVVRMVDEKVSALKGYLDQRKAELLLTRFARVLMDATTGILGFVNALYFLDYEKVKELLAAYAEITGEKMPTRAEWDELRHKHLLETFKQYEEGIRREQVDLRALYADVRTGLDITQKVVRAAESAYVVNVVSGGLLTAMVMFALVKLGKFAAKVTLAAGAAAGAGALVVAAVDEKFRKEVKETVTDIATLIRDNAADVAGRVVGFVFGRHFTTARSERLGQLVGQLYGGITLNKGVFGKDEKTWTQRYKEGTIHRSVLKSQLTVSPVLPILKLLLFNYVYMAEKVIGDSRKSWGEIEKGLEDILLGDPRYRDIFTDDRPLTPANLLRIIALVDDTLQAWLKRLSEDPELAFRIGQVAELLGRIRPDKVPTLKMLRDGTFPEGGWSREAVLFVVLSHLQASLRFLAQSIQAMHTPIEADDPRLSISLVLGLLGFEQNDQEVLEVLDRNFAELVGAEG